MKNIILLVIFFFTVQFLEAQIGSISGLVKENTTQETIIGATVYLDGANLMTITDVDGKFIFKNLNSGTYTIKITNISFETNILKNIVVENNKNTDVTVQMKSESINLQGVTIKEVKKTDTDIAILTSLKSSVTVANGISSEQIGKSLDRDASQVVKRIPGITIIDDRFINVRGLNQRYNNVWINNTAAPSSEADSRAFSLDVIPSSMIDNLVIYKTTSPELPADFAGGFVKIATKNLPEKDFINVSYSIGIDEGTTFNDYYKTQSGSLDWLGIDDGNRLLSDAFPKDLKKLDVNQKIDVAHGMNENWTIQKTNAPIDQRFSFNLGKRWNKDKVSIGTTSALTYSNAFESNMVHLKNYQSYDFLANKPVPYFDFNDLQSRNSVKVGLIHNWALLFGKGTKIELRNLVNQYGLSNTTQRVGTEYYNSRDIKSYEFSFMSRTTMSTQLTGTHKLNNIDSELDWNVGYALANRIEPDTKRVQTTRNDNPASENYNLYEAAIDRFVSPYYTGRLFMKTFEKVWSTGVNFTKKITIVDLPTEWKAGTYTEIKSRKFDARNLGYITTGYNPDMLILPFDQLFADNNISSTGLLLDEDTKRSNSYKSYNDLYAGYVSTKFTMFRKLTFLAGVRAENNTQILKSYDQSDNKVTVNNSALNFFPSLNTSWVMSDKHIIRGAYGVSINRPEFREIAPYNFFDFDNYASFKGKEDLKDCKIYHYDVRYEYYPKPSELISIGVFYKNFENPIELKYIETGSGLAYSYHNALGANNYGVELDMRKNLGEDGFLKDFQFVFNAAFIYSRVYFPEGSIERDVPLQGQSPYIINGGIYYNNAEQATSISLLYNVIGKRILRVGEVKQKIEDDIPDMYEMPMHSLDLMVSKKINSKWELKGGIKNLLNQDIEYNQVVRKETDEGSVSYKQVNRLYNPGRYFSFGVAYFFK